MIGRGRQARLGQFLTSGPNRGFRGGSWNFDSYNCRAAYRFINFPTFTFYDIGFRVVCAPVLP